MSYNGNAGPDWSAFFKLQSSKLGIKREDIISQIRQAQESGRIPKWDKNHMCKFRFRTVISNGDDFFEACMIELLRFCLKRSDFAFELIGAENSEKCMELLNRGQYYSKVLMSLLSGFLYFMDRYEGELNTYYVFCDSIQFIIPGTVDEVRDKRVTKDFLPLRQALEKICGGIKPECILKAANPRLPGYFAREISDSQNAYLVERYGYDFNAAHCGKRYAHVYYEGTQGFFNSVLEYRVLPDKKFWDKNSQYDMVTLLNEIEKANSLTHVKKIWDWVFSVYLGDPVKSGLIKSGVPLAFFDEEEFRAKLVKGDFSTAYSRFGDKYDLNVIDRNELCYPFGRKDGMEEKIAEGRRAFGQIIASVYPDDYEKVMKILHDEIVSPHKPVTGGTNWNIPTIIDFTALGFSPDSWDREALNVYCPDYFSEDNLMNRLFVKAYHVARLAGETGTFVGDFFELMYDMFRYIDDVYGICTSYEKNSEGRDKAYEKLKSLLKEYGADISDGMKGDYVVSILDRKVASKDEAARFPVLEQLGDAVYGFCVSEMLFYNPCERNMIEKYETVTDAKFQVKITRKLHLDELYMSASGYSGKYDTYGLGDRGRDYFAEGERAAEFKNPEKYLADSLEMVIGTVCRDLGVMKAVELTKKILRGTFPDEFGQEVHREVDTGMFKKGDVEWYDFWHTVRPGLMATSELNIYQENMWVSFDKLFMCLSLGTEDKDARNYITQHIGFADLYTDDGLMSSMNWVFCTYLEEGLESTIDEKMHGYMGRILKNYDKRKRI